MSEGGEGVIFDFLRGVGGMDLFWNDPIHSKIIGHVKIALYVRRWVFILYAGEFVPGTKQFKKGIFF